MPRKPDERIEKAKKLYLSGKKLIDIANELGIPEGTVRSWKNRYKWDCNVANEGCNVAKQKKVRGQRVAVEVSHVIESTGLTDKQRLFCILYIRCFNATKAYRKAYGCSYETAMTNGAALLRNARIKSEIQELKQHRLNREMLDEYDIFQKYMDIAFADITDFVEFNQKQMQVFHLKKYIEVDGTLISEIKQGKNGISIKLLDRMKALQWLSDHMDLATEEQKVKVQALKAKYDISGSEDNENQIQFYIPDNGRD